MISEGLRLVRAVKKLQIKTFHEHHHILWDLAKDFGDEKINYVEIGCYEGASACLMIQRKNTDVISIDRGRPIPPNTPKKNVQKFNHLNNNYQYIKGDSNNPEVLKQLLTLLNNQGVHILFIDGGHKYNDVVTDFLLYSSLVNKGGYVVIDDMLSPSCKEVPKAVDFLNKTAFRGYEIIGQLKNDAKAWFPKIDFELNNEFILKKK